MSEKMKYYENIIVGAGASGLYCACSLSTGKLKKDESDILYCSELPDIAENHSTLILEKTARPGTKLLMSGSGQCNITHGGSIKDFISHYGESGRAIRGILQRHNNIELCKFFESISLSLTQREDGKVFPSSMNSRDVLNALLAKLSKRNTTLKYNSPVAGIRTLDDGFAVFTHKEVFRCKNLIVATGGCSYPSTGSDGEMFKVLSRDLAIKISEPLPALTPVYVENYNYGDLSGMSLKDVVMTIDKKTFRGDLLFTHKNLSGPLILNSSRYMKPGIVLTVNFIAPVSGPEAITRFKSDFPGNGKSPQSYMAGDMHLPKRFAEKIALELGISDKKVSQLSGSQIKQLADALTAASFTVSGLAGFREAMVTKGGVELSEVDMSCMCSKKYKGLYFVGEVLDIDGDTGGYNLQFAYSSARAAADDINAGK